MADSVLTIAVDGPGSSGKGTIARGVARELGYQYVDTGAMYRSVALMARRRGVSWQHEGALSELARGLRFCFSFDGEQLRVEVDGVDVSATIRDEIIGKGASDVSAHPGVRAALLGLQRELGAAGGVVMDGRDIGTVVLPDAELKIYLDADVRVRAERRHAELSRHGRRISYDEVLARLEARDAQDMGRAIAPLKQAEDAVYIDSTGRAIPELIATVLALVRQRLGR